MNGVSTGRMKLILFIVSLLVFPLYGTEGFPLDDFPPDIKCLVEPMVQKAQRYYRQKDRSVPAQLFHYKTTIYNDYSRLLNLKTNDIANWKLDNVKFYKRTMSYLKKIADEINLTYETSKRF